MSSRRQRSIQLGGRYRQVSLYNLGENGGNIRFVSEMIVLAYFYGRKTSLLILLVILNDILIKLKNEQKQTKQTKQQKKHKKEYLSGVDYVKIT